MWQLIANYNADVGTLQNKRVCQTVVTQRAAGP
jgi:hypothetical protein